MRTGSEVDEDGVDVPERTFFNYFIHVILTLNKSEWKEKSKAWLTTCSNWLIPSILFITTKPENSKENE